MPVRCQAPSQPEAVAWAAASGSRLERVAAEKRSLRALLGELVERAGL